MTVFATCLFAALHAAGARPEVTWSIMHPVAVEPAYMQRVVDKATEYGGVDSFEICGECNQPHGGLNGLLAFEPYPKTAAGWACCWTRAWNGTSLSPPCRSRTSI